MNHDGTPLPPSDLTLEKYLLGELSEAEKTEVEFALFSTPELQKKLLQLKESNLEFSTRFPKELVIRRIQARRKKRNLWFLVPVPVAAMLLLAVFPSLYRAPIPDSRPAFFVDAHGVGPPMTLP